MKQFRKDLYFFLFSGLLFLSYCKQSDKNEYFLERAENLMWEFPDSALIVLDSIWEPEALNPEQCHRFLLLQIQAKDKTHRDITSDSIIFNVRNYYLEAKDFDNAALASFYCGRLRQEQKNYEEALTNYMVAERYAQNVNDYRLLGLIQSSIGTVFLQQLLKSQAIERFQQAIIYFDKANDKKNKITSYKLAGNAFLINSDRDSALLYHRKGFELAEIMNDSLQLANITQNIGVVYRESDDYASAIRYFRDSKKYLTDSTNIVRLYLNYAKLFDLTNRPDSAAHYIDKALSLAEKEEDTFLLAGIYKTQSSIEEKKLNSKKSLDIYKKYAGELEKIVSDNKKEELLELRNQFQREQFRNENNQLKLKRQQGYFVFSIAFLVAGIVALFFYLKSIQNKKRALEKENQLLDIERKIRQLEELSKISDKQTGSLKNMLLSHFKMLKDFALDEHRTLKKIDIELIRKFNTIVYGQETFNPDIFYAIMNELHNGIFDHLKAKCPELNDREFWICCLSYADFSSGEIATLLGLTVNTVNKKRHAIRKKLGIKNNADFSASLSDKLKVEN